MNEGKIHESTLEKYLYVDETKDEYSSKLKKENEDLEQWVI